MKYFSKANFLIDLLTRGQVEEKKKTHKQIFMLPKTLRKKNHNKSFVRVFFCSAPSFMRPSAFNFFTRTNSNKLFKFMCFVAVCAKCEEPKPWNTHTAKGNTNEMRERAKNTENHYRRYFHVAITLAPSTRYFRSIKM